MGHIIFKKRHSLVLVLGSLLYGYKLLANPELYQVQAYQTLDYALNVSSIAWLFVLGATIKFIGILYNKILFKIIGLGLLGGLWFVIFLGLLIQDIQGGVNAGSIFTGMICLFIVCIAVEEVVK